MDTKRPYLNYGMNPSLCDQFKLIFDNGVHISTPKEQSLHLNFIKDICNNESMTYTQKLHTIYLTIYRNKDVMDYEIELLDMLENDKLLEG